MADPAASSRFSGLRTRLKAWIPPSDLPGANQPTPCNFNRYALLFFYVVSGCLTGVVFFGWPAMASLIFYNEGFSTLCARDPATGAFSPDFRQEGQLFICDAQDAAVQKLYTLAGLLCCVMSACGGALLDFIGPKYTMCLGQLLSITGWLFLAFSGAAPSTYYAGIAFIGLGADVGFLPTMCVTRLLPGSAGLVITLLSSASSASSAVPMVLAKVVEHHGASLKTVALWYICCGPIVSLLIALFLLPRRNYLVGDEFADRGRSLEDHACTVGDGRSEGDETGRDADMEDDGASRRDAPAKQNVRQMTNQSSSNWLSRGREKTLDVSRVQEARQKHTPATRAVEPSMPEGASFGCRNVVQATELADGARCEEVRPRAEEVVCLTDSEERWRGGVGDAAGNAATSIPGRTVARERDGPQESIEAQGEREEESKNKGEERPPAPPPFFKQLFSLRYLLVVVYFVGVACAGAFFQQAPRRMFNDTVVDFMEMMQPLAFLPCIIFGKCADVFGILKVWMVVNTCGLLMYATSMIHGFHNAFGYTSVLLYTLYMSVFSSQVFVYIEETFSPQYFGKMIGLTAMCGGLLSMVSNSLYEHVVIGIGKGDPFIMQVALTVFLGIQYIWIAWLMWLKRKEPNPYRSRPARLPPSDNPSIHAVPTCLAPFEPVCEV
ncbi:putative amino acid transporter [Toxoplasma gondii VEG]|uniref:Amino acid transporter, putative n=1 Tax=Toxoplasma gondii (strain ATCC 50861 / VEG) TaxID=432359 RepID=V4Z0U0_TOXGV|nr:putative amino acid transporter [Toxoplasma gondii VEG]CEL76032.1 TPA: amino acid transporter, putative [Toxoplasma gondii VEG]